jgi:hypothetical protein
LRRFLLLVFAAVLALTVGVAYAAVTETYEYTASGSHKGTPSKAKPANFKYSSTIKVDTDPSGQQPETLAQTAVFFDKGIKTNGAYWPFCNKTEIDGKPSLPAKCAKAVVGSGTTVSFAGSPGSPKSGSVREDLILKAINGPKGKSLYIVVTSAPGAPVAISNRVVPGVMQKSSGPYGFVVRWTIPEDLQEQLGLKISLTDLKLTVPATVRKIKVGTTFKRASFLQLTACKGGKMAVKSEAKFKDVDTGALKALTSVSGAKC